MAESADYGLKCIVKLGGAAITHKHEFEERNNENLSLVASQLREAIMGSSWHGHGMDWSKRIENNHKDFAHEFGDQKIDSSAFVVVHGAGSFGHFQASRSGVHKGGLHLSLVRAGFVATRISVTSLNLEIVRALASEGIPSVGMSPFACGWSTAGRNFTDANISQVANAIDSGLIPVLHGDVVLDNSQYGLFVQGCTILSGDVIIRYLAQQLRPHYVVFLTDVLGVYDRPPSDPNAILLREIAVDEDGSWSIVKPMLPHTNKQVKITVGAHDTTGGMMTKITEAATIAKLGIDVYIVKAGTDHSLKALKGEVSNISNEWLGTMVRSSSKCIHSDV
ncbi:hypothetical protein AMTRI_Chr10g225740 [Amborella trichopoda]